MFLRKISDESMLSQKLVLPDDRVSSTMLSGVASGSVVRLCVAQRGLWLVKVRKEKGSWLLTSGWDKFVNDLQLDTSHSLLFEYSNHLEWKVTVFKDSVVVTFGLGETSRSVACDGRLTNVTNVNRAQGVEFVAVFGKVATYSHVNYNKMSLPRGFVTAYAEHLEDVEVWNLKLRASTEGGRTWPATFSIYDGNGYLLGGWSRFCKDTSVKIGNELMFMVLKWEKPVIQVKVKIGRGR